MELYANIIVEISHEKLDRLFQYRIPERIQHKIAPGSCVMIPFGKADKLIKGYVIEISNQAEIELARMKEIAGVIEKSLTVEEKLMSLAAWMKNCYGGTMIQALKTVLPVKVKVKNLENKEIVLKKSFEESKEIYYECLKKNQKARVRILDALLKNEMISYEMATKDLKVSSSTLESMEEKEIIKIKQKRIYRIPISSDISIENKLKLSSEQEYIVEEVLKDYQNGERRTYLIHGITGSGKTEVYIELIETMAKKGKQCIMLIPEIALTYQTVKRFYQRFQNRVSIINSSLSQGEKFDQFERAKNGEIDVIIGPRSALFTPFPNLGLILIDEEHEMSYKSETIPRYHARETAEELAKLHSASVVLGSATPSLEAFYRCEKGIYRKFELKRRLTGGTLPTVYTVDLREELHSGNRSIFSYKLQELIKERLDKKEQIMLFINRRGYAGFISCRSCGHVMKCPHCDVSLSEHKNGKLICHYCGYTTNSVNICPVCGSKYISGFRAGTQQIEEKLKQLYPQARVLRMDADTTRNKDSYEKILSSFLAKEADVLVGTQMIVKGHDFPDVTLVGVLSADLSLSVGDYHSSERTFQLLTQAAGRAGRGEKPGEVVIQTYQPEHYAIVHAAKQDYQSFYEEELLYRELMQYPPASHMLAVLVTSEKEEKGFAFSNTLVERVKEKINKEDRMSVVGPAPAYVGKVKDVYRHVFYLKCESYQRLIDIKNSLEEFIKENLPSHMMIQFDFDPMSIF